ncbi:MAG: PLP-dependent aminotransferase family protein [Anaerolineae bacterium]|nr:PLP-dependent aminotransferase family protein [Anaerolineae bacterium]
MPTLWNYRYAQRTQRMSSSAIRELLKLTEQPDMISFGGGMPAPELFPVAEIADATARVLRDHGAQALQYSTTEGYRPLREWVCETAGRAGLHASPDNILITTGSQQALDLIGKVFINPGDRLLVENPTYLGAMQAWATYGADYVAVDMDDDGMITAGLEAAFRAAPKFIYALPNFQNPSGVTLSLPRRQQMVDLAERYGVPIVEDDPYGQLRFEGEPLPAIATLDSLANDSPATYEGNVIYLSTFSKILAPGFRLAWVIAPPEVIRKLVQAKQGADLHSPSFTQLIAYEVARTGFIDEHVKVIQRVYRERRDLMLAALAAHFPPEVRWTHPGGGLFLWVTLPEGVDAADVLRRAIHEKVAFVPGAPFHPRGGGENTFRLNFSMMPPDKIQTGIARLGRVLSATLDTPGIAAPSLAVTP